MKSYAYQRLKEMRIKQKHLAEVTGIHVVRLCDLLKLKQRPTPEEAEKLCNFFDRDESEVFELRSL